MNHTRPVFVLGSGRCGTLQIVQLLESLKGVEPYHEYLFEHLLKPAVLFRMKRVEHEAIVGQLRKTHSPAVHYSASDFWVDSSNALTWVVKPLYELFPDAFFIHLIRDGRKVVSSFYSKFQEVMYEDGCVDVLEQWLKSPESLPEPSPEKKYWRPFPIEGEPFFSEFKNYNRFQKLCYYWQDVNLTIGEALVDVPDSQKLFVRFEDLISSSEVARSFLEVFDVEFEDRHMDVFKRPVNVAIPKNFPLSEGQRSQFEAICGPVMKRFGYTEDKEYDVIY